MMMTSSASNQLVVSSGDPAQLAAKATAFAGAWETAARTLDLRLGHPSELPTEQRFGASVLAIALAPIPIAQTIGTAGAVLSPEQLAAAAAASDMQFGGGPQAGGGVKSKGVRVPFMVLRTLDSGWTSGSADAGRGGRGAPAKKEMLTLSFGAPGSSARPHLLMHSFNLVGGFQGAKAMRGARTTEYSVVSPGMVFSISVWEERKIFEAFKDQTGDIHPFDLLVIELTTKSTTARTESAKESRMQIRSVRSLSPKVSAAAFGLVPPRLLPTSIHGANSLQAHYASATHLTAEALSLRSAPLPTAPENEDQTLGVAPIAPSEWPQGLHQLWLRGNLAPTSRLLSIVPSGGLVALGADDQLYYHGDAAFGDASGLGISDARLPLAYETRQFGDKNREWVVKLFNVARIAGALELLVAIDLYRGGQEDRPPTAFVFARVQTATLVASLRASAPITPLPQGVVAAFTETNKSAATLLRHLAVYPLVAAGGAGGAAGDGAWMVVDTRVFTSRVKAGDENAPPLLMGAFVPHQDALWERGHNVHVFVEGRYVFHFVAPITLPGIRLFAPVSAAAAEALTTLFGPPELDAEPESDDTLLGDAEDENDEPPTTTAAAAQPPQAAVAPQEEEAPPHHQDEPAAPPAKAAAKRKRAET